MKSTLLKLLLLFFCFQAAPAATAEKGSDSDLEALLDRCRSGVRERTVLRAADTLRRLASARHDAGMQIAALRCQADFYYHRRQPDSLRIYLKRIEPIARNNGLHQEYYSAWAQLIYLYTWQTQFAFARYEIEKFLASAERDAYKPAMAQAYIQLAYIYRAKGLMHPAADNYRKAIDFIRNNEIRDFALSTLYVRLSAALTDVKAYPEALEALNNASKELTRPEHAWNIQCHETVLRSGMGQIERARNVLEAVEANPNVPRLRLLEARASFHLNAAEYRQADETLAALFEEYRKREIKEEYFYRRFRDRARIRAALGDPKGAYEDMERYTVLYERRTADESESSLDEFAALLNLSQLNREKAELERKAQSERLRHTRSLVFALSAAILLSLLFILLLARLNRKLVQAKKAAEETNRMKSIFIQHMTHEFNTPLNAIVGFAELAATEPEAAVKSNYLKIVRANTRSLQKLMNSALFISDIESADRPPELAPTDVNECCLAAIGHVAPSVNPAVKMEFRPGRESLTVNTSQAYLRQLLTDLLHNAAKFTREGTIVLSYEVASDGRSIRFSVTDTGCGIPAADAERIFERFVKLDTFLPGVGLGLTLCRLIARRLGGEIHLDKSYDKGARFVFTLPVR